MEVLPITQFEEQIVETISNNQVTIIVGDTGSGKTTRIGPMLLKHTSHQVVITQPRRIAARTVAARVASEMNVPLGGLVGFRTAFERKDSPETCCLFCTDGLQLVRELTKSRHSTTSGIVLVIDEVHEWNLNIETLVAWSKKMSGKANFKLVLMSATINAERLSRYFDNAPIITVPGTMYPVIGSPLHPDGIIQVPAIKLVEEIRNAVQRGDHTLVFLPGKPEIKKIIEELGQIQANIFELHGDISPEEQDAAFRTSRLPKVILSTNIAQTSITIPDITCVIDSGMEKRLELYNGVETLTLGTVSKADVTQRAGRAGRVQQGMYILCNDRNYLTSFVEYPIPEIQRVRLDQMVLRLMAAEIDATALEFYHQPDHQVLAEAKQVLFAIGALDHDGNITPEGLEINKFPTSVRTAKMILEALRRKCLGPILTIAAIMETNYSSIRRIPKTDDPQHFKTWMQTLKLDGPTPRKHYRSDLLAELDLFLIGRELGYNQLEKNGISQKGFGKALEIREQLKQVVKNMGYTHDASLNSHSNNDETIIKCILAGMIDHLYHESYGNYRGVGYDVRNLNRESVFSLQPLIPKWIVGTPKNITFTKKRGGGTGTMSLVINCTEIKLEWVQEIAPGLIEKSSELSWDWFGAKVVSKGNLLIHGKPLSMGEEEPVWSVEVLDYLIKGLSLGFHSHTREWFKDFWDEIAHDPEGQKKFRDVLLPYKVKSLDEIGLVWDKVQRSYFHSAEAMLDEVTN